MTDEKKETLGSDIWGIVNEIVGPIWPYIKKALYGLISIVVIILLLAIFASLSSTTEESSSASGNWDWVWWMSLICIVAGSIATTVQIWRKQEKPVAGGGLLGLGIIGLIVFYSINSAVTGGYIDPNDLKSGSNPSAQGSIGAFARSKALGPIVVLVKAGEESPTFGRHEGMSLCASPIKGVLPTVKTRVYGSDKWHDGVVNGFAYMKFVGKSGTTQMSVWRKADPNGC